MTDSNVLYSLELVQQRVDSLRDRAAASRRQFEEMSPLLFQELVTTLEELEVAEEKLRHQAEVLAAARQSLEVERQRYQDLFDFAPDGYLVTDAAGAIQEANRAAAALLNMHQTELVGQPLALFVAEDDRLSFRSHLARFTEPQPTQNWEMHLEPQGAASFPVAVSVAAIRDPQGQPVGLRWLLHDITGSKRVEDALRRQTEQLATLHATVLEIVKPHDLPTLLHTIVERAARLLNAPAGGLYLADPDRQELRCVVSHNTPRDYTGTVLKYGEGAAGTIVQTGESLIIDNYHTWPARAAVYNGEPLTAMLSVPLVWQGQVSGVVFLLDCTETRRFTQTDLELLTLLASQAAFAVENVRSLENEREQRKVAETLREVAGVLNASLDREWVVRQILEQLARVIHCDSASVMLVSGDTLELVAYRSLHFEPRESSPLRIGALKHVQELLDNRVPVIIPDTRADSRWQHLGGGEHTRCWMGVPLVVEDQVIGLLNLANQEPNSYTVDDAGLASAFADQAAVAIRNAQLFEQARTGRERLQILSQQRIEVQESERRRIARELHDEISQVLTGLKLTLETIRRSPAKASKTRLAQAMEFIDELMARVREMSLNLRPTMLDDAGLLPALLWHFGHYTSQTGVVVSFEHRGLDSRFPPELETAAYRVIQESLTNVARYAGVSKVTVQLFADQDMLRIWVEDKGVGFDPGPALAVGGSFGLVGMHERVSLLGGQLTVDSAPGMGTRLIAELPVGG